MDEVTKDFIDELLSVDEDGAPVMTMTIPAMAALLPASLLRGYILAEAARENGYGPLDAHSLVEALGLPPTTPRVWRYQITPNRRGAGKLPCRVVRVDGEWRIEPGAQQCVARAALFWLREYWQKGEHDDKKTVRISSGD